MLNPSSTSHGQLTGMLTVVDVLLLHMIFCKLLIEFAAAVFLEGF
jgi:hypothetical protein